MAVKVIGKQASLGTGKPDFSKDVSSAVEKKGYLLKHGQTTVIFFRVFSDIESSASWVAEPLAPGKTAHLVNVETGEDTPYTYFKGYGLELTELKHVSSEDIQSDIYYEPAPGLGLQLVANAVTAGGTYFYEQALAVLTSVILDPAAAYTHRTDMIVTNLGTNSLTGLVAILGTLEALGTQPLPTTKQVKCKHCGNRQTVPIETTTVICPKCGKLTIYYSLAKYRGS